MKKIIGIVGGIGSGKDLAAEYISDKLGIPAFQISMPIKEIAKERNIEPTRENLVELGTTLAHEFGADYFAKLILEKVKSQAVITGMRQIAQIEYFKANSDFVLISIEADPKIRFQRTQSRGKLGEARTYEEFVQNEINENSGDRVQRLFECMKMADHHILNGGSIDELCQKIDSIVN